MTKFLKKCYKCNVEVKEFKAVKDNITLNCLKCPKCNEEFFTSSELIKYDILTGKRKMIRKFGIVGESPVIRLPEEIIKSYKIEPGDYGLFEKREEGFLVRTVKVK
ncbi:MAG: AbrB/MazE/SpoVT family DNA-binding domain-containing protein [Nanoarchaeota archaeon]